MAKKACHRVFDTTVIAFCNGDLNARKKNSKFDMRLRALEAVLIGDEKMRINSKLKREYIPHLNERRNDLIVLLIEALDGQDEVLKKKIVEVSRNTLTRQQSQIAGELRWPNHDQHVLAAALADMPCSIYATEKALIDCRRAVHRQFQVSVIDMR